MACTSQVVVGQIYSDDDNEIGKIPKNLNECFVRLDEMFDDTAKYSFMTLPEHFSTIRLHSGLGMWIRNEWGLWRGGKLRDYFNKLGVQDPDEMSGIILTSYHRHLNRLDSDFEREIERSQEYRAKMKASHEEAIARYTIGKRVFREFNRLGVLGEATSSPRISGVITDKRNGGSAIKIRIDEYSDSLAPLRYGDIELEVGTEFWDYCLIWSIEGEENSHIVKVPDEHNREDEKHILSYFPVGDTIVASLYGSRSGLFGKRGRSIRAVGIVREHQNQSLKVEVISIRRLKRFRVEEKVGDVIETEPTYCDLIPPKNWTAP